MSTKRIILISVFGILFIAIAIGVLSLTSYLRRDINSVQLPDISVSPVDPGEQRPDTLDRVEITRESVQAVISTLARPEVYSRDVTIESFWGDGQATYNISVAVYGGLTSLRVQPASGSEKRIIVTPDKLYIWYRGDRKPYIGEPGSNGDGSRTADEWQMLVTYEDILMLNRDNIVDAGDIEYNGNHCIYAVYLSPLLGYTMRYDVSIELGLIIGAEEYDTTGTLVYRMTADECIIGEVDSSAFTLPDGTNLAVDE